MVCGCRGLRVYHGRVLWQLAVGLTLHVYVIFSWNVIKDILWGQFFLTDKLHLTVFKQSPWCWYLTNLELIISSVFPNLSYCFPFSINKYFHSNYLRLKNVFLLIHDFCHLSSVLFMSPTTMVFWWQISLPLSHYIYHLEILYREDLPPLPLLLVCSHLGYAECWVCVSLSVW